MYLHAGETSNVNSSRHQDRWDKKTTTTAETKKRMLLLGEMMSKYTRAPNVKPRYDAPSVPRSSVIEARAAGALTRMQSLTERALRVRQGNKHMDLSLFQNGYLTVDELYAARLVQQFNSKFNRSVFDMLERAHSTNDCTEVTCTSCNQIIVRIRPQDWRPSNRARTLAMLPQKLLVHTNQCRKVCGSCGVSGKVLAMEGCNANQIAQHLRYCNEYSANLASYTKYVAATSTFEITRPNCTKHQFNRDQLADFTRRWLEGRESAKNKYVLSRQRRDELEVLVPGALEYFSEKRERVKKEKEEALALPSYKCAVCLAVRKSPSKKSVMMKCLEPSCGAKGKHRRLSPQHWIEVEEEESDKKPAAK